MSFGQLRAWHHAELIEALPHAVIDAQRLDLATSAGQRDHEPGVRTLVPWVRLSKRAQVREYLVIHPSEAEGLHGLLLSRAVSRAQDGTLGPASAVSAGSPGEPLRARFTRVAHFTGSRQETQP